MNTLDILAIALSVVGLIASIANTLLVSHKKRQSKCRKNTIESIYTNALDASDIEREINLLLKQLHKQSRRNLYKNLFSVYRVGLRPIKGSIRITMDVKSKKGAELKHILVDQNDVSLDQFN